MNKKEKIGLIGYGYWGKILYKTLLKLGYENVIVCDVSGNGDIKNYSELEVSHVIIATPPSTHYEICDHFLRRGVNVFCEKPLVTDIEEADKLYDVAEKTGAKLFTDWTFTYNYAVQRLKQEFDAGLLGKIESGESSSNLSFTTITFTPTFLSFEANSSNSAWARSFTLSAVRSF